ncbi:MAG: OadG family protein [Desulfobacterales bacterium]|nr:OadG family protein [Desulfobacterales bacterium]
MYGLEAIAKSNGWAISIVGITIVFACLVMLSTIISQLHKLLDFFEKRHLYIGNLKNSWDDMIKPKEVEIISPYLLESTREFYLVSKIFGKTFSLPKLLRLSENRGLLKPYSTINELLKAELIIPDGKGLFHWSQKAYKNIISKV